MSLFALLLSAAVLWVPPIEQFQAYREPLEESTQRYEEIIEDVLDVAMDPDEDPVFEGDDGREKTAFLMLAIASLESYFRKSVDYGTEFGDGGVATCLMQVHVYGHETPEGYTKEDLTSDRRQCFRLGLTRIRQSFAMCKHLPTEDRLSGYTTGKCVKDEPKARRRMGRALKYWKAHSHELSEPESASL